MNFIPAEDCGYFDTHIDQFPREKKSLLDVTLLIENYQVRHTKAEINEKNVFDIRS